MSTPTSPTSVIRSVTTRVVGMITTEAFAHHFGTTSQQVGVRAGDTLSYVHTHRAAAEIARAFCDGLAVAERHRLPRRVQPRSVGIETAAVAPTLLLDFERVPQWTVGFQVAREISGQPVPAHVWVRVGPVLWQVCDIVAAGRLAEVWSSCARLLAPERRPTTAEQPPPAEVRAASVPGPPARPAACSTTGGVSGEDARDDAALLAAHASGDQTALGTLAVRHQALVRAAVAETLRRHDGIEDATQATWLRVARSAGDFRGHAAVTSWLWRIAVNVSIDILRRAGRDREQAATDLGVDVGPMSVSEIPDPHDAIAALEDATVLGQLLDRLPAAQREAVELVDLQGFDTEEAAARAAVAPGTIKSRRARARAQMEADATRLGLRLET